MAYKIEEGLRLSLFDVLKTAIEIASADFGSIHLVDPETSRLRIVVQQGFKKDYLDFCDCDSTSRRGGEMPLEWDQGIIVEDIEQSPQFLDSPALEVLRKFGVRAVHSKSIISRSGQVLGVLATYFRKPGPPATLAIRIVDLLARQAGDIIERAQALEALQRSQQLLALFIENSPAPIAMFDREMRYLAYSRKWAKAYGQEGRELLNHSHYEIFPQIPERWKEVHQRCLKGEVMSATNDTFLRQDGTVQFVNWEIRPWYEATEKIGGLILLSEDVTERNLAAEERAKLLESEKLARQAAESANQAKDQFLATLSHELRTPITAILSWTQLIRRFGGDSKKVARGIEIIETSAKAQAQLIEDLLDVSRIAAGKLLIQPRVIDPAKPILAAVESIRSSAEAKLQTLELEVHPDSSLVQVDPTRLQQIVWNLLSNAVKFTPVKGRILIKLEHHFDKIRIQISDTGAGIRQDFFKHMFERFTQFETLAQAQTTTTRGAGGLGLGLSIVRHLTEAQGGTIHAESSGEGKGATFVIEFPEIRETQAGSQKPIQEAPAGKELTGIRTLLVEDDAPTAEAIAGLLTIQGAEVEHVHSVWEALQRLMKFRPDVVISDIAMPNEDGFGLLKKIRSSEAQWIQQLPTIAMTAFAAPEDEKRVLRAGFSAFVPKPVDLNRLVQEILRILNKDRLKVAIHGF